MRLSATGNRLTLISPDRLVSGSVNVFTCYFDFDESWDGYFPTAVFDSSLKRQRVEQPVINGECQFPSEMLDAGGRVRVGVYGVSGDKRRPTTYAEWMSVARGAEPGVAATRPPDLTTYEKLLQAIQNGQLTGPQGETGPQGPAGADGLGVPVATAEDAGKVPVVQSDMTYKLEKPSGGGIDLTGASVGQIPRIAIVDDSGKPTAWEAADISCELIASVTLKESAATVEFTGLNLGVGSYTIIIRNTGTLTGAGLSISLNGITKAGYTGVFYNDSGITSANISVLGSYTLGMSFMSNGGKNKYMWDSVTLPITSISVFSPYHLTDETKYFSDGTVVEIYRGVINYNM